MKQLNRVLSGLGLGLILTTSSLAGISENESVPKREKRAQQRVEIKVTPWGRTQAEVDAANARVERSAEVQKELGGTRYRLLESSYIENEVKGQPAQIPARFRVVFYDYTNDRTIIAESGFDSASPVVVRQEFYQPNPNDEEFAEAVRILQGDARFGGLMRGDQVRTFRPMPPVTVLSGTTERLVNIGIEGLSDTTNNEVVSVSINRAEVLRYDRRAPETSSAAPDACGIPSAGQATTSRGTAGQYQLSVMQERNILWEMLVIRPAASSGTMASGIEIRDVKYKGKSVLKRGHAPVLNVQYTPRPGEGSCGPYRDWQYEEGAFNAPATGATYPNGTGGGIVVLADGQTATTALDTGIDTGNFRGVAIYKQNDEIVLISEMNAGWYRYIMEWRFANDGTIRPRYGFGATNNNCVCFRHNHHVYWRFDFDIVNPNNKVFQVEKGRKFLQPITNEITRLKSIQTNRSLLIQNSTGDEAYLLAPNKTDGDAIFQYPETGATTDYGRSDFWVLRYKNVAGGSNVQNEIDDGWSSIGGNCTATSGSCINITPFLNNESVVNQDVVVWYGAHFVHADGANLLNPDRSPSILSGSHVVGPDLRPVRW
ncbi:MAG: hypothetical protein LH472_09740 [Pyrinomonadaceae bacterium]|nr:hypothetical protein [Pyrinomonadaceae bacterium]